jgi:hypothetical protein
VFKKLGHVLLIAAMLATTGAHWFVLQSVAWTTMLADNLRNSSLSDAVHCTFDGKHPCCLCKKIAREKSREKKSEFQFSLKRFDFSHTLAGYVFTPPSFFWNINAAEFSARQLPQAPPTPPPRGLFV